MDIVTIFLIILFSILGVLCGLLFANRKKNQLSAQLSAMTIENERLKTDNSSLSDKVENKNSLYIEKLKECSSLETQVKTLEEAKGKLTEDLSKLTVKFEEISGKCADIEKTRDVLSKQLDFLKNAHTDALAEQERRHKQAEDALKERFDETMQKVTEQLKNDTNAMLKKRQEEFQLASNESIGHIVNPLKQTISDMKNAMDRTTELQTKMSGEMKANIENMMKHSEAAKASADELTRVFKHRSKVQGDWGETVLDELLQSQGLTKGVHYDMQLVMRDAFGNVVKNDEGNSMRPDLILHLDQRRELIIDSKVSLTAFIDYVNADTEDDKQRYLRAHLDSIQNHIKELSKKDYSSYIQSPKIKMDYVIMFVPHSGALWSAINQQPDLWRKAMDKNVFIADEQTLFAALRIINLTWTQIKQAQNHEELYKYANEMINRVGQLVQQFDKVGKALENAQKAYDDGMKKLSPNGQSIINSAKKLINLGAKQNDKNPISQLIDIDEIELLENVE